MYKHFNIPVFIPQLACPFQCIYCDQQKISGKHSIPLVDDVCQIIDSHLVTLPKENAIIEVAFFGGNFTGLPLEMQENFLKQVQPYIQNGQVQSIRLSTRPDYINEAILSLLKKYCVETIELGVQSLDDEVLMNVQRGYTAEDVIRTSALIKNKGFRLGLQMMIGLPGDTLNRSIDTAKQFISLGVDDVRIYPTLVIKETELEDLYNQKKYTPLPLETAVDWCKQLYLIFEKAGINILRLGLHPSEELVNGASLIAGPFHVSIRELVMTAIWNDLFEKIESDVNKQLTVFVPSKEYNYSVGYHASNKKLLMTKCKSVTFKMDEQLNDRNYYTVWK